MTESAVKGGNTDEQGEGGQGDEQAVIEGDFQRSPIEPHNEGAVFLGMEFRKAQAHETGAEHGIDDQGDEERGAQGDDEGDGQKLHELAHDPRPEDHGEKGTEGGQGRGDHRPANFGRGDACRLDPAVPLLHVPVDVLDDDDGVVDQHPQGEDQAEEDDHVEGHAQGLDDDKGE